MKDTISQSEHQNLVKYINCHIIENKLSIASFARAMSVSPSYVYDFMKGNVGVTVKRCLSLLTSMGHSVDRHTLPSLLEGLAAATDTDGVGVVATLSLKPKRSALFSHDENVKIAKIIKNRVEEMDTSLTEISRGTKISLVYLCKFMEGERTISEETLHIILSYLEIGVNELYKAIRRIPQEWQKLLSDDEIDALWRRSLNAA